MRHDIISDVLSAIKVSEHYGKKDVVVPSSKIVKSILSVMQKNNYIGSFELIDDGRGGKFRIGLIGQVNSSKSIRPRYSVKSNEYEKWERKYLPSTGFGIMIVSTTKGIMTHTDAKSQGLGGKLLCFVY